MRRVLIGYGYQQPLNRTFKRAAEKEADRLLPAKLAATFIWSFSYHNSVTGRWDVSQATVGDGLGIDRTTVNKDHAALKKDGILDWDQQFEEIEEETGMFDLLGCPIVTRKVEQRTNQYFLGWKLLRFLSGITLTRKKIYSPCVDVADSSVDNPPIDPDSPLGKALARLGAAIADAEHRPKPPD